MTSPGPRDPFEGSWAPSATETRETPKGVSRVSKRAPMGPRFVQWFGLGASLPAPRSDGKRGADTG